MHAGGKFAPGRSATDEFLFQLPKAWAVIDRYVTQPADTRDELPPVTSSRLSGARVLLLIG
ncbi:MAG: hypothetical protein CBB81_00985 [Cellvibrionales bacterium TMED21]|nr:MAG: hypothetical protein CBB81_00985 [Cellvibrionales bacterium TMED21]